MARSRKFWLLSIFLVGCVAAAYIGRVVYEHDVKPRMLAKKTSVSFELLEANGGLYSFPGSVKPGSSLYVFYLPDQFDPEAQEAFGRFLRKISGKNNLVNNFVLITRLEPDEARNIKRITALKRPLLLDPSGSLLAKVREWSPAGKLAEWVSIELSANGEIKRIASGARPEESWLQ